MIQGQIFFHAKTFSYKYKKKIEEIKNNVISLSIKTITWVNKCLLNINTTFRTSWRQTSFWPASSTSPVNGVSLTWANLQVGHQCQASGLYISPLKYTYLCYFSAPHSACQFVVNFTTPTCLLYFFRNF